jgi:hypothetical protein
LSKRLIEMKKYFFPFLIALLAGGSSCFGSIQITASINKLDLCPGSTQYTELGSILIYEGTNVDFLLRNLDGSTDPIADQYIIFLPTNYAFEAGQGSVTYFGTDMSGVSINVTANAATITFTTNTVTGIDAFVVSGLRVRCLSNAAATPVNMTGSYVHNADPASGTTTTAVAASHGQLGWQAFDAELIRSDAAVCAGTQAVTLTATPVGATSYLFERETTPGTWVSITGVGNTATLPTWMLNIAGAPQFRVTVNQSGCSVTEVVSITVNPRPQFPTGMAAYTVPNIDKFTSDGPHELSGYLVPTTTPAWTSLTFSGTGVIGTRFYPATFTSTATSVGIQVTATDANGCTNQYTVPDVFDVYLANNPPPTYLSTDNPMPFCENSGLQNITITLDPSTTITSITSSVAGTLSSVSISNNVATFRVNPYRHFSYQIPITINYGVAISMGGIINLPPLATILYVNPRNNPNLNNLYSYNYGGHSNIPWIRLFNICSSRNSDSLNLPTTDYGNFTFYKVRNTERLDTTRYVPISNSLFRIYKKKNGTNFIDSTLKFVPYDVFTNALSRSNDSSLVIKITTDALPCPDFNFLVVSFANPTYLNAIRYEVTTSPPYCLGDTLNFRVISQYPTKYQIYSTTVWQSYSWDFGDGFTKADSSQTISHVYSDPGIYRMNFKAWRPIPAPQCGVDSLQYITIGAPPTADFEAINLSAGNPTKLNDLSTILPSSDAGDVLNLFEWNFGDGSPVLTTTGSGNVAHTFSVANTTYPVRQVVGTTRGCYDTITHYLPAFPILEPTPNDPYDAEDGGDFDQTAPSGWYSSGMYRWGDSVSWRKTIPALTSINDAAHGNAWITSRVDGLNDFAHYFKGENSWVESPYFNLASLNRPMVQFNTWCNAENQLDGVTLQYAVVDTSSTVFGKENWVTIGVEGGGTEWYNTPIIISKPMPASTFGFDDGWTGLSGTNWEISAHVLDQIKTIAGINLVRFRIHFTSNSDNAPGSYDGFAFDNFYVGERNRGVLIEEFVNSSTTDQGVASVATDPQAVPVKYFTGHTAIDPINDLNKADPGVRSLNYGINEIPRAVVDGIKFEDQPFNTSLQTDLPPWGPAEYAARTLSVAPFNISIPGPFTFSGGRMFFDVDVTKSNNQLMSGSFVVYVAVLSDHTAGSTTYTNVLRKILPNASGTLIQDNNWINGEVHSVLNLEYQPISSLIGNLVNSKVIVFVQDFVTKEVYQASSFPFSAALLSGAADPAITQGNSTLRSGGLLSNAVVYPNPSSNQVSLEFTLPLPEDSRFVIRNSMGLEMATGMLPEGEDLHSFFISSFTPGIYSIEVQTSNDTRILNFIKQ